MSFSKWAIVFAGVLFPPGIQAQNPSSCAQFNWDQRPLYLVNDKPKRISAAETCPDTAQNGTCLVRAEGDAQFTYTRNLTGISSLISGTGQNLLLKSINDAVEATLATADLGPTSFNMSVIAPIDQTRALNPGQTAYMIFTALFFCFTGNTGNCTGVITDGTPIEVCAPLWRRRSNNAPRTVDGDYDLIFINAADAEDFSDPFANQNSGGGGQGGGSQGSGQSAADVVQTSSMLLACMLALGISVVLW